MDVPGTARQESIVEQLISRDPHGVEIRDMAMCQKESGLDRFDLQVNTIGRQGLIALNLQVLQDTQRDQGNDALPTRGNLMDGEVCIIQRNAVGPEAFVVCQVIGRHHPLVAGAVCCDLLRQVAAVKTLAL